MHPCACCDGDQIGTLQLVCGMASLQMCIYMTLHRPLVMQIAKVADPDGWLIAFIDNNDFADELKKAGTFKTSWF